MPYLRVCAVLLALVFGLGLAGCCGGGSDTVVKKTDVISTPTLGQQLEDLDSAYKTGAISKEEYEKLRKELVDKGAK